MVAYGQIALLTTNVSIKVKLAGLLCAGGLAAPRLLSAKGSSRRSAERCDMKVGDRAPDTRTRPIAAARRLPGAAVQRCGDATCAATAQSPPGAPAAGMAL